MERYEPLKEKQNEKSFIDYLEETKNIFGELSRLFSNYKNNIENDSFFITLDNPSKKLTRKTASTVLPNKKFELLKEQNNHILRDIRDCLRELKDHHNRYKSKIDANYHFNDKMVLTLRAIDLSILKIIVSCVSIRNYAKTRDTFLKNNKDVSREERDKFNQLALELREIKDRYTEFRDFIYKDYNSLILVNNNKNYQKISYIEFNKWKNINFDYIKGLTTTFSDTRPTN